MTEAVSLLAALEHRDEHGRACAVHPAAMIDVLLHYALVGARNQAFNHDCASKLQGLMMALDDLSETSDARLRPAIETASTATGELHALLNQARALTRPPVAATTPLRELIAAAADRVRIKLRGTPLPDVPIRVAPLAFGQALSIAFDVAAGPGRTRDLGYALAQTPAALTLALALAPSPANAGELLAIAAYAIARDRGALYCSADGSTLTVRIALS